MTINGKYNTESGHFPKTTVVDRFVVENVIAHASEPKKSSKPMPCGVFTLEKAFAQMETGSGQSQLDSATPGGRVRQQLAVSISSKIAS